MSPQFEFTKTHTRRERNRKPIRREQANSAASYDSVGATTWDGSLDAVRRKGSVIFFGNASGPVPTFPIARLSLKNTKIMRATVMQYLVTRDELEHYSSMLFEYLRSGKLKVNIHGIYEAKEIQRVHQDLEARVTSGKLLIKF